MAAHRELRTADYYEDVEHLAKVDDIAPRLAKYDAATTAQVLILVAENDAGPYTIIDGTHRATALYRNYLNENNLPWRGILIADPAIAQYEWHIDSPKSRARIALLRRLDAAGALR